MEVGFTLDLAERRTHAPGIVFLSLLEECFPSHSRRWALNAPCRNLQFLEHTVTRGPVPSALAYSTVPIELKWPQTCYYPDSYAFCSGSTVLGITVLFWTGEMVLNYGALGEWAEEEVQSLPSVIE